MMTATCLDLIGADGPTIVEGPFAANRLFAHACGERPRGRHRGGAPPAPASAPRCWRRTMERPRARAKEIEPPADPAWADYARAHGGRRSIRSGLTHKIRLPKADMTKLTVSARDPRLQIRTSGRETSIDIMPAGRAR